MDDFGFLVQEDKKDIELIDEIKKEQSPLMVLISRMLSVEASLEETECKLKRLKETYDELTMKEMPELLDSLNYNSIKLKGGAILEIKEDLFCKYPSKEQDQMIASQFLNEYGSSEIVKSEITLQDINESHITTLKNANINFSVIVIDSNLEEVNRLLKDVSINVTNSVNTNTLKSTLKDLLGMKKGGVQRISFNDIPKQLSPYKERRAVIKY